MKNRQIYWLLAAVDGTDSNEWRSKNKGYSHTNDFFKKFGKGKPYIDKIYKEGPGITGSSSLHLAREVARWLRIKMYPLKNFNVQICLVGHSRGGTICIHAAKELIDHRIYYLGLYDAVDRAFGVDGETILNVDHIVHAKRGLSDSRTSFGNAGLKTLGALSKESLKFNTSHGGIGGAPEFDYEKISIVGDFSCAKKIIQYVDPNSKKKNNASRRVGHGKFITLDKTDRIKQCKSGSKQAHSWMLEKAKRLGMPI